MVDFGPNGPILPARGGFNNVHQCMKFMEEATSYLHYVPVPGNECTVDTEAAMGKYKYPQLDDDDLLSLYYMPTPVMNHIEDITGLYAGTCQHSGWQDHGEEYADDSLVI